MLTPNYYCYILLELSIKLMRYESIYAVKCGNVVCHRFQTEMLGSLPCTSVYRKAAERNMEGESQKWNYHGNHRTWGHGSYSQENTNDAGLAMHVQRMEGSMQKSETSATLDSCRRQETSKLHLAWIHLERHWTYKHDIERSLSGSN